MERGKKFMTLLAKSLQGSILSISTFLLATISISSFAQQPIGIDVTGKAEVLAVPDKFTANFTLSERAKSADKAKAIVDHKSKLLVKAIASLAIPESAIESARISIQPIYIDNEVLVEQLDVIEKLPGGAYSKVTVKDNARLTNHNNKQVIAKKQLVYQVSRVVTVHLVDIDNYERLLDQATKIGVNKVAPLNMSISNAEALYKQALSAAIINAQEKAQTMAKQLGQILGPITYLKEVSYGVPARMMMSVSSAENFSPHIGKKSISAQVNASFSLIR